MNDVRLTMDSLRRFSPLDSLKRENIAALVRKVQSHRLETSRTLFREGDADRRTFYLLSGTLQLTNHEGTIRTLRAGSDEARSPISPLLPRRWTARAVDRVEYLAIDTDLLDVMLTWDQTGSYEVQELDATPAASDDWMAALLQSNVFQRVPPANLQAIFLRMQKLTLRAGDVVIKQGAEGDYFYAITHGRCSVTRETPLNRGGIKLAELSVGDTFGEEALISEARRNATVTMLEDGTLMRLAKSDFQTLLNEPMLDWVDYDEARRIITGGGKWLDVRLPSEFDTWHEPGAIHIPLYFIRLKLGTLDRSLTYVLCCDTGRRSSAGAFILNERGFTTRVLKGGLHVSGDRPGAVY
jgi:CRP-like cAMP-binding protein